MSSGTPPPSPAPEDDPPITLESLENELRTAVSVVRKAQTAVNIASALLASAGIGFLFCALLQFALEPPAKPLLLKFAVALGLLLWGPLYLAAAWLTSLARLGSVRNALIDYLGHSPMQLSGAAAAQWQDPFTSALSTDQESELNASRNVILVNVALRYFNVQIPVVGVLSGLGGFCAFYGVVTASGLSALSGLLIPAAAAGAALTAIYFLSPVYASTPSRRSTPHDADL